MQRWFLILMLVLLPLRGWSAQLMGVQMGAMQMASAQTVAGSMASHADMSAADMPADCPMHLASITSSPTPPASDAQASVADSNHPTCQACQLCMPLALLTSEPLNLGGQHSPLPLPQAQMRFVSAELHQVAKPPIL
jgi:hypothetical protein